MLLRLSSSAFARVFIGKLRNIARTRPSRVVSKAVPRPLVTLPIEPMILSRFEVSERSMLPMALDRPSTVPMKPRIGMAQRKTLTKA